MTLVRVVQKNHTPKGDLTDFTIEDADKKKATLLVSDSLLLNLSLQNLQIHVDSLLLLINPKT